MPKQAKILRDIPKAASWSDREPLGASIGHAVRQFVTGKIAGSPNQTIDELLDDLHLEADGNEHQKSRVDSARGSFENFCHSVDGQSWQTLVSKWSGLDDRIEKLFMDVHKNKATVSGVKMEVGRSYGRKIDGAAEGETQSESWRKRGSHGGIDSRLPKSDQHYVVGNNTSRSRVGPERVFTANARTGIGHEGIHACYSPTHGDSKAKGAKEYILVDNTRQIGNKRLVAPWDPYLKTTL